jgi:hypothetical protein
VLRILKEISRALRVYIRIPKEIVVAPQHLAQHLQLVRGVKISVAREALAFSLEAVKCLRRMVCGANFIDASLYYSAFDTGHIKHEGQHFFKHRGRVETKLLISEEKGRRYFALLHQMVVEMSHCGHVERKVLIPKVFVLV